MRIVNDDGRRWRALSDGLQHLRWPRAENIESVKPGHDANWCGSKGG